VGVGETAAALTAHAALVRRIARRRGAMRARQINFGGGDMIGSFMWQSNANVDMTLY
jgi:hypothetical protein